MQIGVVKEVKANEYRVGLVPGSVRELVHVVALATKGWKQALRDDPHLRSGLNVAGGRVAHAAVAAALQREAVSPEELAR